MNQITIKQCKTALKKSLALLVCLSLVLSLTSFHTNATTDKIAQSEILYKDSLQSEFSLNLMSQSANTNYGDFELTLPQGEAGTTFNVDISILRYYSADDNPLYYGWQYEETYYVDVSSDTSKTGFYEFMYTYDNFHERPELSATIQNVEPSSVITINDILFLFEEFYDDTNPVWSNFKDTYVEISVTDNVNYTKLLTAKDANPVKISDNSTASIEFKYDEADSQLTTSDVFASTNYNVMYFLNNYNVLSLDDIEATHIVGPIIAQDMARRTTETVADASIYYDTYNPNNFLAVSDYSRGAVSYVGTLVGYGSAIAPNNTSISNSALQLNYYFDRLEDDANVFKVPNLYTREHDIVNSDDISIFQIYSANTPLEFFISKSKTFLSPNDYGTTGITFQNDNYINFDTLSQNLIADSQTILTNGGAEGTKATVIYKFDASTKTATVPAGATLDSGYGYYEVADTGGVGLKINAGESWEITDATNLEEVNIILPDTYDYYNNPYLLPTTISFSCSEINPTFINGVSHSQFPYTLINGYEFTATTGRDGEYSEVGNKIVWNLPNVVTTNGVNRLVTFGNGQNIAGHIVAPQAEFWNYSNNLEWEGGNINGAVIAKSFYSGNNEMHMWPYNGLDENGVFLGVVATKTVDSVTPSEEYDFELDIDRSIHTSGIPTGILNTHFPISSTSFDEGVFIGLAKFSSLVFDQAGTYYFTLSEVLPSYSATDNMIYDQSVYKIEVVVSNNAGNLEISSTYTQTQDENGNSVSIYKGNYADNLIIFNNKTQQDVTTFDVHLFKRASITNNLLADAEFSVIEVVSSTDHSEQSSGYNEIFKTLSSGTNGNLTITDLEVGKYYKLQETVAPSGYDLQDGYWILTVNSSGVLSISNHDGALEVDNYTIYNTLTLTSSIEISLTKQNQLLEKLVGVNFDVEQVVLSSSGLYEIVVNGYKQSYISDADGKFTIEDLSPNHTYKITETSTPSGHIEHTGYWIIVFSSDGDYKIYEYNSQNAIINTVSDLVLENEKDIFYLPETGGNGIFTYQIIGFMLISTTIIIKISTLTKKKRY